MYVFILQKEKFTLNPKELENGPVVERVCRDLICCLVFLAFLVGMVGVSGYGLNKGNPKLLTTLWGADKLGCGYSKEVVKYPYLYFPTIDLEAA